MLSCQLAEISGTAVASEKTLQSRNESLQKMVHLLEAELDRKNETKEDLEKKLTIVESEFDSYKIRAQSVLRQANEKDTAIGAKALELASLERVVQSLNEKISDMR
jgi:chromosome segregation ATPase